MSGNFGAYSCRLWALSRWLTQSNVEMTALINFLQLYCASSSSNLKVQVIGWCNSFHWKSYCIFSLFKMQFIVFLILVWHDRSVRSKASRFPSYGNSFVDICGRNPLRANWSVTGPLYLQQKCRPRMVFEPMIPVLAVEDNVHLRLHGHSDRQLIIFSLHNWIF
jgi:hypothetical protein